MGEPMVSSPASGRWLVRAWLANAGSALASVVLPAGCRLCQRLLTGASRLPVCKECLASFSRIHGSCRCCGSQIEPVSGDENSAGSAELFAVIRTSL
jgi:hypothetical protein